MKATRLLVTASVLAVGALSLSACVNNSTSSETSSAAAPASSAAASAAASTAASAAPSGDAAAVTAASLVPADIASTGKLVIGIDATYPPNEYKDADGNPIGWEVDLMNAVAEKLGLSTEYVQAKFDNILPGITGGKYQLGLSSFFDTKEREQQVDMVNYYTAGIQWASAAGKDVDPNNACGLTLAVQNGTTEALDDAPAKSKACTDAGKEEISILGYDTQDEATAAVTLGRADALSADSPVTQYAVAQSKGKLQIAGDVYDIFLYGMPVPQGSAMGTALQAALIELQADGTYSEILSKWGVEGGAITDITINGAQS
ncbi:MAG: ABC transporter substrate-binding protein [Actinobacteria bacterium]|nr:ABC transporter substrate-binding protein [Actinomycetota bacterium]